MISNGDFMLKYGDYFDYGEVGVGNQNERELSYAIEQMNAQDSKNLPNELLVSFSD